MPSKKNKKKSVKSHAGIVTSRTNGIPKDIITSAPLIDNNKTSNSKINDSKADDLLRAFTTEKDPARKLQILKNALLQSGTKINVLTVNAVSYKYSHNDVLYGDGDQSKITLDLPRFNYFDWFRNLDDTQSAHFEPFSFQTSTQTSAARNNNNPFLTACLAGNPTDVENLIKKTKFGSKERSHLLNGRDAFFRRSALLMVAKSRKVMKDRVGTIRILLKYGARPDARDICGNHILHYLANHSHSHENGNGNGNDNVPTNISSKDAIQIADDCINAARCCKYFGKKVIINNISASAASSAKIRNHSVGTLQGYIHDETYTDTGRFTVVLETETLCLRPCNLFQKDHKRGQGQGHEQYRSIHDPSRKLYNEPNRSGAVCIQDYIVRAAKEPPTQFTMHFAHHILIAHNADMNGLQFMGKTLEELAFETSWSNYDKSLLQAYFNWKAHERKLFCRQCDKGAEMTCSRCDLVCYCSKECQRKHFGVHKKTCISPTSIEQEKIFEGTSVANMTLKGYWVGEIFWLKVTHDNSSLTFVDRYGGIFLNVKNKHYFSNAFLIKAKKGTHVKAVIRLYPTRMLVVFPDTTNKRSW